MSNEPLVVPPALSSSHVIANYELLSDLTGQMRDAAEQSDWDRLISVEEQRSQLLARMKPVDAVVELDEAAYRSKVLLIKKIQASDAEIRDLTQAWMGQLQLNIKSDDQAQRVRQAYGV